MAETMTRDGYLATLNRYFECTAGAVSDAGGEVLSFIGDAVLAIFPYDTAAGRDAAARKAVAATRDALHRRDATNAIVNLPITFGIGIHHGKVMFGNIGVPDRLSFSVDRPDRERGRPSRSADQDARHARRDIGDLRGPRPRGLAPLRPACLARHRRAGRHLHLGRMTTDQIILFALFGAVLALLLWGRFRYDLVAFFRPRRGCSGGAPSSPTGPFSASAIRPRSSSRWCSWCRPG